MSELTVLTSQIYLDTIDSSGAPDAFRSDANQVWQPKPVALSSDRFIVKALKTYNGLGSDGYYTYYSLDGSGNIQGQTNFIQARFGSNPITYSDGAFDGVMAKVDASSWVEMGAKVEYNGTNWSTIRMLMRKYSVSDSGAVTLAYSTNQQITSPNPANSSQLLVWGVISQVVVTNNICLVVCRTNKTTASGLYQWSITAWDVTTGQFLWYQLGPDIQYGYVIGIFAAGSNVSMTYLYSDYYGTTKALYRIDGVVSSSGISFGAAAKITDLPQYGQDGREHYPWVGFSPYIIGGGWVGIDDPSSGPGETLQFHIGNASGDVTYVDAAAATPDNQALSYYEQWPWWPPQSDLIFAPLQGRMYTGFSTSVLEQGARAIIVNPITGVCSVSPQLVPIVNGVSGDSSWWKWDETNGGSQTTAWDAASGKGIYAMGWVSAHLGSDPYVYSARAWMLQGPAQIPNLSAQLDDTRVRFSAA